MTAKVKCRSFLSSRSAEAEGAHTTSGSPETFDETLGLGQSVVLPADNKAVVSHLVYLFALATKILIIQIFLLNCCNFLTKFFQYFYSLCLLYTVFFSFVLVMSSEKFLFS